MQSFVYDALPARVVFGSGTVAQITLEAERLGVWYSEHPAQQRGPGS